MHILILCALCILVVAQLELPIRPRKKAGLSKRAVEISGNDMYFLAPLEVELWIGDPVQPVITAIDTTHSDLVVLGGNNTCVDNYSCDDPQFLFNFNESQSISTNASWNRYLNSYVSSYEGSSAGWGSDKVAFGPDRSYTLDNVTMLIVPNSETGSLLMPLLGIGPIGGESCVSRVTRDGFYPTYPNFPQLLQEAGYASSLSYSISLNSSGGSLLFGAYDRSRFNGNLSIVPIVADTLQGEQYITQTPWMLSVNLYGIQLTSGGSKLIDINSTQIAIIDTSAFVLLMPASMLNLVARALGAEWLEGYSGYIVPCDISGSITFEFAPGLQFSIPLNETLADIVDHDSQSFSFDDNTKACRLNIGVSNNTGGIHLGQVFLKYVYTIVHLNRSEVALASANPESNGDSYVVPIVSSIPSATYADVGKDYFLNKNGTRHIESHTALSEHILGSSLAQTLGAQPTGAAPVGEQGGKSSKVVADFTIDKSGHLEINKGSRIGLELFWWMLGAIWFFV